MSGRFTNLELDPVEEGVDAAGTEAGSAPRRFFSEEKQVSDYLEAALAAEMLGDAETALRQYSAALGEDPLLLEAWIGQLRMLIELGEYPETEMWSGKALEHYPDNPQILSIKAVALYRMGRTIEARDLSDAALAKKGERELIWLCRGDVMMADARAAAEDCLEHAVRVAGSPSLTRLRAGGICCHHGHYKTALGYLEKAVAAYPKSAQAWYWLGTARRELGMESLAMLAFRQAVDLAPANASFRAALSYRPGLAARLERWFRKVFRP